MSRQDDADPDVDDIYAERRNEKGQFTKSTELKGEYQEAYETYKSFAEGSFDKDSTETHYHITVEIW